VPVATWHASNAGVFRNFFLLLSHRSDIGPMGPYAMAKCLYIYQYESLPGRLDLAETGEDMQS
jgi:hypothetical protein